MERGIARFRRGGRQILGTGCRGLVAGALAGGCVDEGVPAQPVCELDQRLRIDELVIPIEWDQASAAVVGVDADAWPPNGAAYALLYLFGFVPELAEETAARVTRRIRDDVVWTLEAGPCDDGSTATAWTQPRFPLAMLADMTDAGMLGWHRVRPAGVELTFVADDRADGRIGGALAPGYDDVIARAILPLVQARLDAGEPWLGTAVDADGDGIAEVEELTAMDTWRDLMEPNVDADGDGEPESLSFGFEIGASVLP